MKRSARYSAALGATIAIASTATACGHNTIGEQQDNPSHIVEADPQATLRLRQAATHIISLAKRSPTDYEGKPAYSISFQNETVSNGQISYSVQTATERHDATDTELIEVQQTGSGIANFDLSFNANDNGTWNMYCATDLSSAISHSLNERDEQIIERDGKTLHAMPKDAQALLNAEITYLDGIIDHAQAGAITVPAVNACSIKIG